MQSEPMPGRCLVTGASGFIGGALFHRLRQAGMPVRGTSRQPVITSGDWVQVGALGRSTDWSTALQGCDVVVHAAGRAHVMHDPVQDPLEAFREVNVQGTLALARQALEMGVQRFVFISSIGANGAETLPGQPFNEACDPRPQQAYARSKLEAEQALQTLLTGTSMEWVIVRPPLVYASQAPGNFSRLLQLVARRLPLPLGRVDNARSMIALQNLTGFLELCLHHPAAAGEVFVIADGEDISTARLVELMAQGMGRSSRLLPVPPRLLRWGLKALGRDGMGQQLCGSLQVDASKARNLLGWRPEVSAANALRDSARQWLARRSGT